MRTPQIYTIPADRLGVNETVVLIINGTPVSLDLLTFTEDGKGSRTWFTRVPGLTFTRHNSELVSVIRT